MYFLNLGVKGLRAIETVSPLDTENQLLPHPKNWRSIFVKWEELNEPKRPNQPVTS